MKVTLIRPPSTLRKYSVMSPATPPIGLAYVASSLIDAGHEVEFIDTVGEAIDHYISNDENTIYQGLEIEEIIDKIPSSDAIGVSIMFSQDWLVARDLLNRIHENFPQSILFVGGEHVTAVPEEVLGDVPGVQFVLTGEGDQSARELLEHVGGKREIEDVSGVYYREGNRTLQGKVPKRIKDIDSLPWPSWSLVPLENYLSGGHAWGVNRGRSMPMMASRGCPYQCTFCSNPTMWTTRWLARSPEDVIQEMKHYIEVYQAENFDFHDLTAIVKKDWILTFCKLLIDQQLNITWQLPTGTRSEAIDEEVSSYLWAAGCKNIGYAPESGSDLILKKIKKRINKDKMTKSIKGCLNAGMNVKANFIFGFPGDTYKMHCQTVTFMWKLAITGLHDISISPFCPYPGSELFRALQKDGKIPAKLDDNYYKELHLSDMEKTVSWTEHISSKNLNRLRNLALLSFYLVSWARYPHRPFKIVFNFIGGKEEGRMDKVLAQMRHRFKNIKKQETSFSNKIGGIRRLLNHIHPY